MTSAPPPERDDDSDRKPGVDVDAQFNDIISRWDTAADVADRPTPVVEPSTTPKSVEPKAVWNTPTSQPRTAGPRDFEVADVEEEFVAPTPTLGRPTWRTLATWVPLVGVPIFGLFCAFFWRDVPQHLIVIASALFVLGATFLFSGLSPQHRDDNDDGAVV